MRSSFLLCFLKHFVSKKLRFLGEMRKASINVSSERASLSIYIYNYITCILVLLSLFLLFHVAFSTSLLSHVLHTRRGDVSLSSLSLTTASKATGFGFLLLVCSRRLVSFFRSCWRCSRRRRRWWCCCCWDEAVGFVVETFV